MNNLLFRLLPGVFVLVASGAAAPGAQADALVMPIPPGLQLVTKSLGREIKLFEWVGPGETTSSWREMLTAQILKGLGKATPAQWEAGMSRRWLGFCPTSRHVSIASGHEYGHAFSVFFLSCLKNPSTGLPEFTWVKAIQGEQDFFVVQRAFKTMPSNRKIVALSSHLKSALVCSGEGCGRQGGRTVWQ